MKKILIIGGMLLTSYFVKAQGIYVGWSAYNDLHYKKEVQHFSMYQIIAGFSFEKNRLEIDFTPIQLNVKINQGLFHYATGWNLSARYYVIKKRKIK